MLQYNKSMQTPVDNIQSQHQSLIPDFIRKLQAMIENYQEIISFSQDGTEIHIHDHNKFTTELLPKYFRHHKWRSFIRQMNMYNFKKLNRGVSTYIFVNPIFWKGNQDNYHRIKRKINTKEEEQEAQRGVEEDMKALVASECRNLGIPNNEAISQNRMNNGSLKILPTQSSPLSLPLMPTPFSSPSFSSYTNSLTYFLDSLLTNRKQTQTLLSQIRQNMQVIGRERKNTECKNILNNLKDSMQMIQEISNKFKDKIQGYVDEREGVYEKDESQGGIQKEGRKNQGEEIGNYVNWGSGWKNNNNGYANNNNNVHANNNGNGYVNNNGNGSESRKMKKQKSYNSQTQQQNQIPHLISFSSASSINLVIPQPIIGIQMAPIQPTARQSQQCPQRPQTTNTPNINNSGYINNMGMGMNNRNTTNMMVPVMPVMPMGTVNNVGNNGNIFGQRSFSSFTYLINFQRQ